MSVREKVLVAEARWLMGRVMVGDFLDGVGKCLHRHVMGEVLTRPYEIDFKTLGERKNPLAGYTDKTEPRFTMKQESGLTAWSP